MNSKKATSSAVVSVSSPKNNGAYKAGDEVPISVTFSEAVTVTGTPRILLETGAIDRDATYTSGSGTKTLVFTYVIMPGDYTDDLDYQAADSLDLNGGSIKFAGKNDASITLAVPGASNSLSANKTIVIDTTIPSILNVSSSRVNGTYTVGAVIDITVTFSKAVNVTGSPRILLETGPVDRYAVYSTGSGTNAITFSYTIMAGDITSSLEYSSALALGLNSGTINDAAGNAAVVLLQPPGWTGSLSSNNVIAIDTNAPVVTNVSSSTVNGSYKSGQTIAVTVSFSKNVSVTGTPRILLETGSIDRYATYTGGSGSSTLTFTYVIQSGDSTSDLDYKSTTSLELNGGHIYDSSMNPAVLTLAIPAYTYSLGANKSIVVDAISPTVLSVSATNANATYNPGAALTITMTFSEAVTVTGSPQIALNMGNVRQATYSAGTGTTILSFTYTTAAGDMSNDLDYTSSSAFTLNGGTIRDAIGNNAVMTLAAPGDAGSLGANKNLVIVDNTPPIITNVTSTKANGSYSASTTIDILVTFSKPVTVTGLPRMLLETGATDQYATFASGSGTGTLTFSYTVLNGDTSSDLDYTGDTALELNAGTIKDSIGNNATLTLALPGNPKSLGDNRAIIIDTTKPTVTNVTSTKLNGSYKSPDTVEVTVKFSEIVNVAGGTPRLLLETGTTDRYATYSTGSGTDTLTFTYTITSGDISSDLDYQSTSALDLNSASIFDNALNGATLTLATPGAAGSLGANKAIVIDTAGPTVLSVTSTTTDGTYGSGTLLSITATFSENVSVTGLPQIALNLATARQAVYTSGHGTSTLTFTYTTVSSDTTSDLDYTSASALTLNSGTITDGTGNSATLTLPNPGAANSIASGKAIIIDTSGPTVTSVTSTKGNGTYGAGTPIIITATFSKVVTVVGTPRIELALGSARQATYTSGSGTNTLSFTYTTQSGDTTPDLNYSSSSSLTFPDGSTTIKDNYGNNAILTLPALASPQSLAGSKAIVVDTTAPTVLTVSATNADGPYGVGKILYVTVAFSEIVTVASGTPAITLNLGTTRSANYNLVGSGTNTLTFSYTIAASDISSDLNYVSTSSLTGNIIDSVGNAAALTLPALSASNSIAGHKAIVVDTVAPVLSGLSIIQNAPATTTAPIKTYYNSSTMTPAISWTGYTLKSDETYEYCVNSSACTTNQATCNIVNWSTNGSSTSKASITTSGLTDASDYFHCVRAKDTSGNVSDVVSSSGWIVDLTIPVFSTTTFTIGASPSTTTSTPTITFPSSSDTGGSGVSHIEYCIRLSTASVGTGCTWTKLETSSGSAINNVWLAKSTKYKIDLRVKDLATNASAMLTSAEWTTANPAWKQESYMKPYRIDAGDDFGRAVAIADNLAAVGAPLDDSNQTTITSYDSTVNNTSANSGGVHIFERIGVTWSRFAYIKASDNTAQDNFGYSVAMTGNTLVVGAPREQSKPVVILGTSSSDISATPLTNTNAVDSGAVYVYKTIGTAPYWQLDTFIKAFNADESDLFGYNVSIFNDRIAVGVHLEDSNQTTITNKMPVDMDATDLSNSADNSHTSSGAVYVYKKTSGYWRLEAYIKSINNNDGDFFGKNISITADTLAIGAPGESSNQTTITNGTSASDDNSSGSSGAVYVYKLSGSTWTQQAFIKASNNGADDGFGTSVSLYGDTLAVGAPYEDSNLETITSGTTASTNNDRTDSGAVYIYKRTNNSWTQEAYLKAVNSHVYDNYGASVSLYNNLLAVGAPNESSNVKVVTNAATASTNTGNPGSGAVYAYRRVGSTWTQEAYLKPYNNWDTGDTNDHFGHLVSVSNDSIMVGAYGEDSTNTSYAPINNTAICYANYECADNASTNSGAAYIFRFIQ